MIIAFLLITGVALFYLSIVRMDIAESYVMSAATLILMIYAFGLWKENLLLGRKAYTILAGVGFLVAVIMLIIKRLPHARTVTIFILALFIMLLFCRLICYGDFIRHIDEFHMWAIAPKYMLSRNRLPIYEDFVGNRGNQIGTCIFNYYFQSFTGYNEGMMYASTMFLTWIGLFLPFGNEKNQNWIRNITYVIILYFSFSMLYIHGTVNAYADVVTGAWMAGLVGWCIHRKKGRRIQNIIVILTVLFTDYMFKGWTGIVLWGFFLFLLFIRTRMMETEHTSLSIRPLRWLTLGIFLFCVALVIFLKTVDLQRFLPEALLSKLFPSGYSLLKVNKTLETMLINICGKPLTLSYQTKISFLEVFGISIAIIVLFGLINNSIERIFCYCYYVVIINIIYLGILFFGHISTMSYLFSTTFWAGHRYLSILAIFLMVTALSLLMFEEGKSRRNKRYAEYVALGIMLFFIYGVRTNYLCYHTPINKEKINYYATITKQRKEGIIIQKTVGKDKKIYFLNQKADYEDEFEADPALYYFEDKISSFRWNPWQYDEEGATIWVSKYHNNTLDGFPGLLSRGNYSYVWIYQTNDFLNQNLPKKIKITDREKKSFSDETGTNILDGQLYEVIYNDAMEAIELRLIKNLKPYDERHWHNGYN